MPDVLVRCAFHSISVVCCSLDRAGTGALAALGIRAFENFSDRFAYLRLEPLRGKSRLAGDLAADHTKGPDEGEPVRIEVSLISGLTHEVANSVVRDQETPYLLFHKVRLPGAEDRRRPALMGLEFVHDQFDFPPLVICGSQLQGGGFGGIPLRRQRKAVLTDRNPARSAPRRKELVTRLLAGHCELCQQRAEVVIHQVSKLADLIRHGPPQPAWAQLMAQRRRKTLVVCSPCHDTIHAKQPATTTRQ